MQASEKTFRHSWFKVLWMFVSGLLFAFILYADNDLNLIMLGIIGLLFVMGITFAFSTVKISMDGVTTTSLLGAKSLMWSEIARVSTRGQSVRLHNRDEDVALTIDSQLGGYIEILDLIFSKRPELFDLHEDTELSRSVWGVLILIGVGSILMGFAVLALLGIDMDPIIALVLFGLGAIFVIIWFLGAQKLELDANSMTIVYLYKRTTYTIDEINAITLEKRRTRNGYIYFVQAHLKNGKKVNLPTFKQGSALSCQILKRWHAKGVAGRQYYST